VRVWVSALSAPILCFVSAWTVVPVSLRRTLGVDVSLAKKKTSEKGSNERKKQGGASAERPESGEFVNVSQIR